MATFNEEENIGKCLSSVADWVDEIVVVDGTSTDKTVDIAKGFKAKIIITDNPPIFHINKKKAIEACAGEWILQLDADEVVTDELKKEILTVINDQRPTTNSQTVNGYWIPRKNYFLGKFLTKGGQYPDYSLRLYRRGKGNLPAKNVHEQAVVEGQIAYLKNPLLHYSYPNFNHYLSHFNQYTDIFARELKDQKIKIGFTSAVHHTLLKPLYWFLLTYIRHKGFMDGFPGFAFSLFSAMRFPVSFIKYWEKGRFAKN